MKFSRSYPDEVVDQYVVYLATCLPTRKQYVGTSVGRIRRRWSKHRSQARKGRSGLLYRAIREYGAGDDAFSLKLLGRYESEEEAKLAETKFIEEMGTLWPNGLNAIISVSKKRRKQHA